MTPDQITALAREYAEEEAKGTAVDALPNGLKESVIQRNADHFEKHLRFLLRRYYMVEKDAVRKEYGFALDTNQRGIEASSHVLCAIGCAQRALLESLFPEIAKEVEE